VELMSAGEFGHVIEWSGAGTEHGRFLGASRWMNDAPWFDDLDVAQVFRDRDDAEWFLRQSAHRHWREHTRIVPLRAPTAGWASRIRISDVRRQKIADYERWLEDNRLEGKSA
jgi:hypothetical protein